MKPKSQRSGFTVPELLIAFVLSGVAITSVVTLFLFGQKGIQAGMANFELAKEMRIVRENIVRGFATDGGMRSASYGTVTVGPIMGGTKNSIAYNVDTNLWPTVSTADDVWYSIGTALGLNEYQRLPGFGSSTLMGSMISSNVGLQYMVFSSGGNMVTANVTLVYSTAGKTYTKNQIIVTRIPNP